MSHEKNNSIFTYFSDDACCPGVVTPVRSGMGQGEKPEWYALHQSSFFSSEQRKVFEQHFIFSPNNDRLEVGAVLSSTCTRMKRPGHKPLFLINRWRGKGALWTTGVGVSRKVSHGYSYHGNHFLLWGFQRSGA